jgi:hypothetical protein
MTRLETRLDELTAAVDHDARRIDRLDADLYDAAQQLAALARDESADPTEIRLRVLRIAQTLGAGRTEPKETTLMKRREAIKFMVSIADEYDDEIRDCAVEDAPETRICPICHSLLWEEPGAAGGYRRGHQPSD